MIVVRNNSVNALVERFVEDQNMVIRLCDKSKLDGLGSGWVGSQLFTEMTTSLSDMTSNGVNLSFEDIVVQLQKSIDLNVLTLCTKGGLICYESFSVSCLVLS